MRLLTVFLICFSNMTFGQEVSIGSYYHFGENVLPFGKVESEVYPTYFDLSYEHTIAKKYFLRASFAAWAFDEYDFQNYKNTEESFGIRLGIGGTAYKFWNDKIHLNWMFSGRNYDAKIIRTSLFFGDVFTEKKYEGYTFQASPIIRWQFAPHWQLSLQSHFSLIDVRKTNLQFFANGSLLNEEREETRTLKFPSDFLIGITVGYSFKKQVTHVE